MNLKEIDSQVSYEYVNPLYPKSNEDVEIKIRIINKVEKVRLFVLINGAFEIFNCNINSNIASYKFNLKGNSLIYYYFMLIIDGSVYYYDINGIKVSMPCKRDMFRLKSDIRPPIWVGGSTCYQIFPDRFKNGNSKLDVKENEYEFDGAFVKTRNFNEKPLSFEEGRCLDFFNGDLYGIIDSIDHFKELGVTALYINPIGVSKTTHRYDCCDFFHVDPKLGGDQALIELIDIMHKNNIKVVIDISINHTGISHPWLLEAKKDKNSKEAEYYYIDSEGNISCWYDVPTLPQLNYTSSKLRDIMYRDPNSVLKKFIEPPFNQDGWRLDVAETVGRRDKDQLGHEIWKEVNKNLKDIKDDIYLVGESWNDSSSYLQGDQWDATMNYIGSSRPFRRFLGEEDRFTCDSWGESPKKVNSYNALDLKQALESNLNTMLSQMLYFQMNFIDTHDTPRLHTNDKVMDFNIYESMIMLMYVLPGMPSVYYGDEVKLDGSVESVEMWRYPMQWDKNKWDYNFYNLYKNLGKIRLDYNNIFKYGSHTFLNCNKDIMVFARYYKDESIVLLVNKSNKDKYTINLNQIKGKYIKKIYGDGQAELKNRKIYCQLKTNKSLLFYLNK